VTADSLSPVAREFMQGPMTMKYTLDSNLITGSMEVNGQEQDINITTDSPFILDGPSLDSYLASLDLNATSEFILQIFDSQGQKIRPFKFKVEGEDRIGLYDCFRCRLESIDGSEKTQRLWLSKSLALMVKKTSVIKEMGGAKMDMYLKRK